MKLKLILLGLLLMAFPAFAQNDSTVGFDGFSFSLPSALATSVNITQFAGDPPTLEQPGGPDVKHVQFNLYTNPPAPESLFDAPIGIRVYRAADFAGYDQPGQVLTNLQTLLAQKPDLAPYAVADTNGQTLLPFLPVMPAGQVLRAQIKYVDTPSLHGISYITIYRQDVSPFLGSEFLYTFQGLSADGSAYVTMVAKLNTTLFPAETPSDFNYETFSAQYNDYLTQSITTLNSASPTDFTPSLTALDALVQSFSVSSQNAAPTTPAAPATPAVTPITASLGGLDGVTWTLVSYGDPANPTPALTNPPTTVIFDEHGVSGSTGCNTYSGSFQFENDTIRFSPLTTTLIACDQPIMDQESAFLDAMNSTTTYTHNEDQLTIDYDGGVLTFQAS